jgi:hypothetical protein
LACPLELVGLRAPKVGDVIHGVPCLKGLIIEQIKDSDGENSLSSIKRYSVVSTHARSSPYLQFLFLTYIIINVYRTPRSAHL